jgi:hypothetical protein
MTLGLSIDSTFAAISTLRASASSADRLALPSTPITAGVSAAIKIASTVMTTISSTSVKPFCFIRTFFL